MLLLIFGAGASHDSSPKDEPNPNRSLAPPLAAALVERHFDHIAARIPMSRPIIQLLRTNMNANGPTSLETELASIAEDSHESAERRQQLVAFRFYLHQVIENTVTDWLTFTSGFTHYLPLLNHIYAWHKRTGTPVRVVTFNYDVLLETALSEMLHWSFLGLADYIARDDFRLFKLHGSTSWVRCLATQRDLGTPSLEAAMGLAEDNRLLGGEIMVRPLESSVGPWRRQPSLNEREVTVPAMAVPMAGKTEFECPEDHIQMLRADLPKVTHVLIIGWRAAEPHAIELLAGSEPPREGLMPGYKLGVVSFGDDGVREVRQNLGEVWGKGRLSFEETDGFSRYIARMGEHMEEFLGLREPR